MTDTIRVLLVDDHTLFRRGLAELLDNRSGVRVVGATGDPDEALRMMRSETPDVALVDLNMPPAGGLSLLERIASEGLDVPVVVLTVSDDQDDLAAALRADARGYLLKDMEPEDVVDAIQRAVRGETVVAPAMTMKLVNLLQTGEKRPEAEDLINSLTRRERQILEYLARGASNKSIARSLSISHDTVKLHVRHILFKLNVTSRVEAAVFAVENRLLSGRAAE